MSWRLFGQALLHCIGISLLTLLIYLGIEHTLQRSEHHSLLRSGEAAALRWTEYIETNVSDFSAFLVGASLDEQQSGILDLALAYTEIDGFELFDSNGNRVLISETLPATAHMGWGLNIEAMQAFISGSSMAKVIHEPQQDGSTSVYVETYTPVEDPSGTRIGVFKIYVEHSTAHALVKDTLGRLSLLLPGLTAFIYALAALGFLFRSRQVRAASEDCRHLTHHDALTGLLNRKAFETELAQLFQAQIVPGRGVGLILINIDEMKFLNDEGGDELGDAYLQFVARAVEHSTRHGMDLLARTGGDELAVAVADVSVEELRRTALRIQEATKLPCLHLGQEVVGSVSFGVHLSAGEESASCALAAADTALNYAQAMGKGSIALYADGMDCELRERRELETLLRTALRDGTFELYFQPIVAADSWRIDSFEASARLPDVAGGIVSPARFIPLAEELGILGEVTAWVLENATRTAKDWPEEIKVSVNLTLQQFGEGNLVNTVADILGRTGFPTGRLELEITQSLLIAGDEAVDRQLVELKQLGVSIAMDDFGTGYSSLNYLMKYGFDKIKIDRSFIEAWAYDPGRHGRIIETIVDLGHNLGMRVTIEGVENRQQIDFLQSVECDLYQGYFFGRPMTASKAAAYIHHQSVAPGSAAVTQELRRSS
ncbi:MAG: bifunctional diguanylate cyclase/phosphodiesterase [Pseudomonadota bacterium]